MKKYFSLLLVLAMCLVACNGKKETAKSSEQKEMSAEASVENQGPVFVDLGLPSGTKWKTVNEHEKLTFDKAISLYGENVPTKEQFQELITYCVWTPIEGGYTIKGPSGNSIMLPYNSYAPPLNEGKHYYVGGRGGILEAVTGPLLFPIQVMRGSSMLAMVACCIVTLLQVDLHFV